jgi:hypothetical protein
MIRSVSGNQTQILKDIMTLYCPQGFEADFTYSTGGFYRDGIPQPKLRCDLVRPEGSDIFEVDARSIPLPDNVVKSAVFDPPFIHAHGKDSQIGNRFSSYPSQKALHEMYEQALAELYRVLAPKGVLVFKCMDCVESGKQVMSHCLIWQAAVAVGFKVLDFFVLTAENRIAGHNHGRQVHARKFHCYLWVFQKPTSQKQKTEVVA